MPPFAFLLAAAVAQPGSTTFDVRCMLAAQVAVEQVEADQQANLQLAVMFYFGRADSALSEQALEETVGQESVALEGQDLGPILTECGGFMEQRGDAMMEIGARLETRESARQID